MEAMIPDWIGAVYVLGLAVWSFIDITRAPIADGRGHD